MQDAAYGTFVEYTNLVGALGFLPTVEALATRRLVCIDEFELDDPGDTVLMSRLLRELADRGVALAATSNTLPGSLGEGRFAAEDFLREIQALAARFEVLRVDGDDYRHRSRRHRRRRARRRRGPRRGGATAGRDARRLRRPARAPRDRPPAAATAPCSTASGSSA